MVVYAYFTPNKHLTNTKEQSLGMLGTNLVSDNGKAGADGKNRRAQTLMVRIGMRVQMAVADVAGGTDMDMWFMHTLHQKNTKKKILLPHKLKGQPPKPQILAKHAGLARTRS